MLPVEQGREPAAQAIAGALAKRKWLKPMMRKDDKAGWTVLPLAARQGLTALVQNLAEVENAPLDDLHRNSGLSALMCAAMRGHEATVRALCGAKASLDIVNPHDGGKSALFFAAIEGHQEVVEALLACGAKGDLTDEDGMTAAHWALLMEHKEVRETILNHLGPSSRTMADKQGTTPQQLLESLQDDATEAEQTPVKSNEQREELLVAQFYAQGEAGFVAQSVEVIKAEAELSESSMPKTPTPLTLGRIMSQSRRSSQTLEPRAQQERRARSRSD